MDDCELPRELLIEILVKLPVKSLMRCKCVCKCFYDLIKNNHQLLHRFYEVNREKCDYAILEIPSTHLGYSNKMFSLLYNEPESDDIGCTYLDFPNSMTRFVSCCDGMLCFILGKPDFLITSCEISTDLNFDILIWNPFIREIKALPSIKVPHSPPTEILASYTMYEGFGFGVSKSMAWKVVMLWYFNYCAFGGKKQNYECVMVCSQDGDGSWSWRQIDALPNVPVSSQEDFYCKGKYYWRVETHEVLDSEPPCERLLWFDLEDEVFGTIGLPTRWEDISFTVMNETIAMISLCPPENSNCIEVWLMSENADCVDWHKQWSVECCSSIDRHEYRSPLGGGTWRESWLPIGIWNQGGGRFHLIAYPCVISYQSEESEESEDDLAPCVVGYPDEENYVPYLVLVDLETQELKMIYLTKNRKCVELISNSTGYAQVYKENNSDITQEWKDFKVFPSDGVYARIYNPSLKFV
ncbi:unnamed protein product [Cuscuta epithymum]|uniref:F-box domain-containing protein n=1 Tax=Cuscuta epithymum TaxID=186058 RepID=A0AAV0DMW7_9ASTE|nr:unnamed protein product [Cuscuta epithymum]